MGKEKKKKRYIKWEQGQPESTLFHNVVIKMFK